MYTFKTYFLHYFYHWPCLQVGGGSQGATAVVQCKNRSFWKLFLIWEQILKWCKSVFQQCLGAPGIDQDPPCARHWTYTGQKRCPHPPPQRAYNLNKWSGTEINELCWLTAAWDLASGMLCVSSVFCVCMRYSSIPYTVQCSFNVYNICIPKDFTVK